jgi:hypothetical protein
MSDGELPSELLFDIFTLLDLKGLIKARTVRHHWRNLVLEAPLDPTRRVLLDLYYKVIAAPSFLPSRALHATHLLPSFDREAYIQELVTKVPFIPAEFEMWVLEWPAKAVIGGLWPGIDADAFRKAKEASVYSIMADATWDGWDPTPVKNLLPTRRTDILGIAWKNSGQEAQQEFVQTIAIWNYEKRDLDHVCLFVEGNFVGQTGCILPYGQELHHTRWNEFLEAKIGELDSNLNYYEALQVS